mmetsp:Transcript_26497/g.85711  ORF Transcript_26497/g.85711 Transcript_26497/m.85711 type:complete len:920 (-) Transcript_26497:479-3238(-)
MTSFVVLWRGMVLFVVVCEKGDGLVLGLFGRGDAELTYVPFVGRGPDPEARAGLLGLDLGVEEAAELEGCDVVEAAEVAGSDGEDGEGGSRRVFELGDGTEGVLAVGGDVEVDYLELFLFVVQESAELVLAPLRRLRPPRRRPDDDLRVAGRLHQDVRPVELVDVVVVRELRGPAERLLMLRGRLRRRAPEEGVVHAGEDALSVVVARRALFLVVEVGLVLFRRRQRRRRQRRRRGVTAVEGLDVVLVVVLVDENDVVLVRGDVLLPDDVDREPRGAVADLGLREEGSVDVGRSFAEGDDAAGDLREVGLELLDGKVVGDAELEAGLEEVGQIRLGVFGHDLLDGADLDGVRQFAEDGAVGQLVGEVGELPAEDALHPALGGPFLLRAVPRVVLVGEELDALAVGHRPDVRVGSGQEQDALATLRRRRRLRRGGHPVVEARSQDLRLQRRQGRRRRRLPVVPDLLPDAALRPAQAQLVLRRLVDVDRLSAPRLSAAAVAPGQIVVVALFSREGTELGRQDVRDRPRPAVEGARRVVVGAPPGKGVGNADHAAQRHEAPAQELLPLGHSLLEFGDLVLRDGSHDEGHQLFLGPDRLDGEGAAEEFQHRLRDGPGVEGRPRDLGHRRRPFEDGPHDGPEADRHEVVEEVPQAALQGHRLELAHHPRRRVELTEVADDHHQRPVRRPEGDVLGARVVVPPRPLPRRRRRASRRTAAEGLLRGALREGDVLDEAVDESHLVVVVVALEAAIKDDGALQVRGPVVVVVELDRRRPVDFVDGKFREVPEDVLPRTEGIKRQVRRTAGASLLDAAEVHVVILLEGEVRIPERRDPRLRLLLGRRQDVDLQVVVLRPEVLLRRPRQDHAEPHAEVLPPDSLRLELRLHHLNVVVFFFCFRRDDGRQKSHRVRRQLEEVVVHHGVVVD